MSKHTPGPLLASNKNALQTPAIYRATSDGKLASRDAIGEARCMEDARLWAASPSLLSAAKELMRLMDDVPPDPTPGLSYEQNDRCYARYEFDDLRDAIARAEETR